MQISVELNPLEVKFKNDIVMQVIYHRISDQSTNIYMFLFVNLSIICR